jgi:UDP-N-acetylmuramyl tripeptide synthase
MNIEKLPNPNHSSSNPELTDEVVMRFLKVLEEVRDEDLSCADMYARLDEFVEAEIKEGTDAEKITPLIHEHLDMCSDCCDEYEALLSIVEHTQEDNDDENKKN